MIPIQKLSLGDISVNFAQAILDTLRAQGIDHTQIQKKFGLNDEYLSTPNTRISIPKYMRLGREATRTAQDPALGLQIGQCTLDSHIGIAAFTASCAPSLDEALSLLIDMERLNSHNSRGKSSHHKDGERFVCRFYSISPYNQFNFFVVDAMLATWWSFVQRHCNGAECHHVDIEYPEPKHAKLFEEFFKCPVRFGQKQNALTLKQGHEKLGLAQANPSTFNKLKAACETELSAWQNGKSISDQVSELISENLSGTPPEIEVIARKLGMAGWTLRRRLSKEGIQYQTLLDNTRNALAQTYVRETDLNFTEIAFLLGFSSPPAFQRAFKRWTQISPGEFRRRT